MANVVFYHSVPNNIPGILWFQTDRWNALFPERTLPNWLPELLDNQSYSTRQDVVSAGSGKINTDVAALLRLVKHGVCKEVSLAWNLGLDRHVVAELMLRAQADGLLTARNRMTEAGRRYLANLAARPENPEFNNSIYVPQSWCAGRESVQPSGQDRASGLSQAESEVGLPASGGEVGQASLERTDAKTAAPSLTVTTQRPSKPREGRDAHGPKAQG